MEQRLNTSYLRPGLVERSAGIGLAAAGIGTSVLFAAWGISFLWRYTPPEIAVRIANPEVYVSQNAPFVVKQDKPFLLAPPEPLNIEPGELNVKVPPLVSTAANTGAKPSADAIKREVTVFSSVRHGLGNVVTGWNYRDGTGGSPVGQYCYYIAANVDHTNTKVDIASNGIPAPNVSEALVPDLKGAMTKCQWWLG
jgi:hypothetical protein